MNRLIGGADPARVVFTAGGTDALNLALFGVLQPGSHAVAGVLEHTSVTRPLADLRHSGVATSILDCGDAGFYSPDDLDALLSASPPTALVVLSHGSNVAGTVQPIAALAATCRRHDALFLLDACQTAGHVPIDADGWGVDLLATGGHKGLLGPAGVGVLYVGERAEPRLRNTRFGGTGAGGGDAMPPALPHRLEPGTPNLPGVAGLGAAVDWIERRGVEALHERSVEQIGRLIERLTALPGVRLIGPPDATRRCGLVTVALPGWDPTEAAAVLDASFGIACRSGLHCAPAPTPASAPLQRERSRRAPRRAAPCGSPSVRSPPPRRSTPPRTPWPSCLPEARFGLTHGPGFLPAPCGACPDAARMFQFRRQPQSESKDGPFNHGGPTVRRTNPDGRGYRLAEGDRGHAAARAGAGRRIEERGAADARRDPARERADHAAAGAEPDGHAVDARPAPRAGGAGRL